MGKQLLLQKKLSASLRNTYPDIIGYTDAVSVGNFKTTDATFVKVPEGSIERWHKRHCIESYGFT
jgi:hypothetical protein